MAGLRNGRASFGVTRKWFMAGSARDLDDLVQRGYRFALSLTHDANRAEDLIQDAWFSILRAGGPWQREYLFTTVRNRFIDSCRRNRIAAFEPLDDARDVAGAEHYEDSPLDDDIFIANGAFDQALGKLRAEERAVLYLHAVENCTAQQIAELLEWPRGTVLSMLHRARGKLRTLIEVKTETES